MVQRTSCKISILDICIPDGEKLDIRFDTLKTCIYQINPETLELGELLECEGSNVEYFEWNKQTKSFDEVDSNSLSDEEEEYFH